MGSTRDLILVSRRHIIPPPSDEKPIAGTVVCMRKRLPILSVFRGLLLFCALWPSLLFAQDSRTEFDRGKSALEAGRIDEAESILSQLVSTDPQAAHYYYRGLALGAKGKDVQAIDDFSAAITLDPRQAIYYFRRGIILLRNGRFQEAVNDFTKTVELDPDHSQALGYRARALFMMNRRAQALQDLARSIQRNPNDGALYALRGDILSSAGEYASAIRDYDKAIQLRPNDPTIYNNRGIALANVGKTRQALADVNAAMDMALAMPPSTQPMSAPGSYW